MCAAGEDRQTWLAWPGVSRKVGGFQLDAAALLEFDPAVDGVDHELPPAAADCAFGAVADEAAGHGQREIRVNAAVHGAELDVGTEVVGHRQLHRSVHGFDLESAGPPCAPHSGVNGAVHALSFRPLRSGDLHGAIHSVGSYNTTEIFGGDTAIHRSGREAEIFGQVNGEIDFRILGMHVAVMPMIAGLTWSH